MTIWLMNHYATSMFFSKAGRHYWFAKELKKRGNDVTVFCANTSADRKDVIDTKNKKYMAMDAEGTPFLFVKTTPYEGNGLSRVKNMLLFAWNLCPAALSYAKEHGKPDVIVASSVHPLTMAAGILTGKKLKVPCICEIRDLWPEAIFQIGRAREASLLGKVLIAGEHWIYKKADALIFTKEGDVDYLKERGWTTAQGGNIPLEKCHYINNGVDLDSYDKWIREGSYTDGKLEDSTKFHVIYTGTIRPINNVGNLLDCAAILKRKNYRDIKIFVFGDGIEYEGLKKRAEDEKLDNIVMEGAVERKYIPGILAKADVNLLHYTQSKYNWSRGNSSNKLFEYMASGKPVISTIRTGYSIIQKYQCGTELGSDDPQQLADAIIHYYEMPPEERQKIGDNARKGALDFDFARLTDKLVDVIESVVR